MIVYIIHHKPYLTMNLYIYIYELLISEHIIYSSPEADRYDLSTASDCCTAFIVPHYRIAGGSNACALSWSGWWFFAVPHWLVLYTVNNGEYIWL